MSRTDVHRPEWVQHNDPHARRHFATVTHHHWVREHWDGQGRRWLVQRSAPCDLEHGEHRRDTAHRCTRWPTRNLCGCRLCVGQAGRKQSRRRERTALQAARRAALKTARADRDSIDIPPPKHTAAWVAQR